MLISLASFLGEIRFTAAERDQEDCKPFGARCETHMQFSRIDAMCVKLSEAGKSLSMIYKMHCSNLTKFLWQHLLEEHGAEDHHMACQSWATIHGWSWGSTPLSCLFPISLDSLRFQYLSISMIAHLQPSGIKNSKDSIIWMKKFISISVLNGHHLILKLFPLILDSDLEG